MVTGSKWARWLIWSRTIHPSAGVALSQSASLRPARSLSSWSVSACRSSAISLMSTGTASPSLPHGLALLGERLRALLGIIAQVHRFPDALGLVVGRRH